MSQPAYATYHYRSYAACLGLLCGDRIIGERDYKEIGMGEEGKHAYRPHLQYAEMDPAPSLVSQEIRLLIR